MKQETRGLIIILVAVLCAPCAAFAQHRMISIGDRHLSMNCDGQPQRAPTIVLMAGAGRTAKDWAEVQPAVSSFARVCSYDRAGFGESEKAAVKEQSADEIIDDLHALLKSSGEKGPFILVAHSVAGIFARRFVTKYPAKVVGLVFVDSSHEEQALRLHELDPQGPGPSVTISLSQRGQATPPPEVDPQRPGLGDVTARLGFYVKPGERLKWRTELPLIVLGRGKPTPRKARDGSDSQNNRMTEEQFAAWDRIWRGFQEDLAKRSPRGELRIAEQSGHLIQLDQPNLVIQAIRDLIRKTS